MTVFLLLRYRSPFGLRWKVHSRLLSSSDRSSAKIAAETFMFQYQNPTKAPPRGLRVFFSRQIFRLFSSDFSLAGLYPRDPDVRNWKLKIPPTIPNLLPFSNTVVLSCISMLLLIEALQQLGQMNSWVFPCNLHIVTLHPKRPQSDSPSVANFCCHRRNLGWAPFIPVWYHKKCGLTNLLALAFGFGLGWT